MRLVSWNVAGLPPTVSHGKYLHGSVEAFLESFGADIICFQETKLTPARIAAKQENRELALVKGWDTFCACCTARDGYSGVATFVRKPWTPENVDDSPLGVPQLDAEGRVLVTDHGDFVLFNVYAPNAANPDRRVYRLEFLKKLENAMEAYRSAGRAVILCGDLNIAAEPIDVYKKIRVSPEEHAARPHVVWFSNMVRERYVDSFRYFHPGVSNKFTCWDQRTNARATNAGTRIDYFIVSSDFFKKRVLGTAGAAQAESKPAGKGRAEGKETPEDEDTAPASILLTNAKMSDHAAVSLAVADPESARPHRESHALAARNWKSLKPAGKSLFAMGFGKPKAPPAVAPTTGASGATPSTRKARGGAGAALGDGAAAEPAGSRAAASGEPAPRAVKRTAERSGPLAKMFAKRVRQEQETG